jgi:hypothetical protein
MKKRGAHAAYIGIGALYVVVKVIFISMGYLHRGAIIQGLIPALLTVASGALAVRETKTDAKRLYWNRVVLVLPVLVLAATPLYMYPEAG